MGLGKRHTRSIDNVLNAVKSKDDDLARQTDQDFLKLMQKSGDFSKVEEEEEKEV